MKIETIGSNKEYVSLPCGRIIANILRVSENDYKTWRRTEILEEFSFFVGSILFITILLVFLWHLAILDRPVVHVENTISGILSALVKGVFFGFLFIVLLTSAGLSSLMGPPLIASLRIRRKRKEFLLNIGRADIDCEKVSSYLCDSITKGDGYLIIAKGQSIESQI